MFSFIETKLFTRLIQQYLCRAFRGSERGPAFRRRALPSYLVYPSGRCRIGSKAVAPLPAPHGPCSCSPRKIRACSLMLHNPIPLASLHFYATQLASGDEVGWNPFSLQSSGDDHTGCQWIDVIAQGVPAHIGSPTLGLGYESGDPYSEFLPPATEVPAEDEGHQLRAVVFVIAGTERVGQRYVDPLLVLSGQECEAISFADLHERMCSALRGGRPRFVAETWKSNGTILLHFDDGSSRGAGLRDDRDEAK